MIRLIFFLYVKNYKCTISSPQQGHLEEISREDRILAIKNIVYDKHYSGRLARIAFSEASD